MSSSAPLPLKERCVLPPWREQRGSEGGGAGGWGRLVVRRWGRGCEHPMERDTQLPAQQIPKPDTQPSKPTFTAQSTPKNGKPAPTL